MPIHLDTIQEAARRIASHVHRTPVLTSRQLDERTGAQLFFKSENFQRSGAFKFRGASNAVLSLGEEEAARGVLTHSSGNHAGALALAARERGIPAHIVMPENAPAVKLAAVRGYGAEVRFCEPTLEAREREAAALQARTGACFVHPYDDERIVAGQGTAALELLQDVPELDWILAPVGGGGLLSGTALAAAGLSPDTRVVGAEPAGADDARRSLEEGRIVPSIRPNTIADGLLTSLSPLTFGILRAHVHGIETVGDGSILEAMRLVWERMKLVIEPSAAVPLAVLLERKIDCASQRVGVILSGGNIEAPFT
ncbi:MAG: pyridoxal-phosphate dependent enzyme [Planctomycetota bacterium]